MKRLLLNSLLALTFASSCQFVNAMPEKDIPPNNGCAPGEFGRTLGLEFMKTPEYTKQIDDAVAAAKNACESFKPTVENGKSKFRYKAVVLDVDETVLNMSKYYEITKDDQPFDQVIWDKVVQEASCPAIEPVAAFARWAREHGFWVILITGRLESERSATIQNLVDRNVPHDLLLMKPDGDLRKGERRKAAYREYIEYAMGAEIAVTMGDQWSDLRGGYAQDFEKLPNKMYCLENF